MAWEALLTAAWLGIMTAISPCPMATNIAAISFIGRKLGATKQILLSGLLYTLGRCLAYLMLGIILVYSLLNAPMLSDWLQRYMNVLLGPLLVVTGMFLLELISLNIGQGVDGAKFEGMVTKYSYWSSLFLGFLFALSFCPVSAALFFGSLLPLALKWDSPVLIPLIYGLMTALPVLMFALLIAFGISRLGQVFNVLSSFEKWARKITGVIFILVGIYYVLIYIYGISF